MKKIVPIILIILMIVIFNLTKSSTEPLPDEKLQLIYIVLVTIYSIVVLVISIYLHSHPKPKGHIIETENLPSPILSEAIIDGKIGTKELIFSSIVDFALRENIKFIGKDTIELVSTNNLTLFEKSILELIFQEKNIIHINRLDDVLINSSGKINEIKEKILEELYEKNIFNYLLTKVNKLMGTISVFILVNLPLIFKITNMVFPIVFLDISLCIYYYRRYINKQTHEEIIIEEQMHDKYGFHRHARTIAFRICIVIGYFVIVRDFFNGLSLFFRNNIIYFILMFVNMGINIYIISKANKAVYTDKGKLIEKDLQKLKNYIKDYHIINDEKIESIDLWDKYVAYAVAFRISKNINKV